MTLICPPIQTTWRTRALRRRSAKRQPSPRRREGRYLYRLEEALRRLFNDPKHFGQCHTCQAAVGFERLDALPHARYCIDCKRKEESAID